MIKLEKNREVKLSKIFVALFAGLVLITGLIVYGSLSTVQAQEVAYTFDYPIKPYVVSGYTFGEKVGEKNYHLAEDAKGSAGTSVYACANGEVKLANDRHSGYGGLIIIEHIHPNGEKVCSLYGHLDDSKTLVRPNSPTADVESGQEIGKLGDKSVNGGYSEHLHFGIRYGEFKGEDAIDPNTSDKSGNWYWAGYGKIDPKTETNWWLEPSKFIEEHQEVPNIIYVPDDFSTIQDAVDAATAGNTIIVRDGTYFENIDVNKDHLIIKSENGAEATIVRTTDANDHVFEITANYVEISGFTVKDTSWPKAGIHLKNVELCSIVDNFASNNEYGIYLHESNNCIISSNNAWGNDDGIILYSSKYNIITDNKASENEYGIVLRWDSNHNTIKNNIANSNSWDGICLTSQSKNNILSSNTISNNGYGVALCIDSNNNEIYLNNFINNNIYIHDSTNIWNSPEEITYVYNDNIYTNYLGNYWDDYTGNDANNDGIGDSPYPIESDNDNYPLMVRFENLILIGEDTTPPTVSSVSPQNGASDVAIDTVVTATFSEAMDSSTITTDSFTLAGSAVSGTVTYDSNTYTASFTPDANLEYNHEYTATLSTDITDEAGNPLEEPYSWSFTTPLGPNQPPDPPTLLSQYKIDGTEIPVGGTLDESTVIFKGVVNDPDDDQVKLQIELRRLDEYEGNFIGEYTQESEWVSSGSEASVTVFGLVHGAYHWQARAVDERGATSDWVSFGNNPDSEVDFFVRPEVVISVTSSGSFLPFYKEILWLSPYAEIVTAKIADLASLSIEVEVIRGDLPVPGARVFIQEGSIPLGVTDENGIAKARYLITHPPKAEDFKAHIGAEVDSSNYSSEQMTLYSSQSVGARSVEVTEDEAKWYSTRLLLQYLVQPGVPAPGWLAAIKMIDLHAKIAANLMDYNPQAGDMHHFESFVYTASGVETAYSIHLTIERGGVQIYERTQWTDKYELVKPIVLVKFAREAIAASLASPANLWITDPNGRHAGIDPQTGELVFEFSMAITAPEEEHQQIVIPEPLDGEYMFGIIGTQEGSYNFICSNIDDTGHVSNTFTSTNIPTAPGAVQQYTIDWAALTQGEEGVTIQIDSDGDGVFEQTFSADDELSQEEYLSATDTTPPNITNVTATNITTNSVTITWVTDELSDSLVKYGTESGNYTVQKYNSTNVTSHTINLTELLSNTTYYYLVNSTDARGNANESVEYNFTTVVISDTTPPGSVSNLGEIGKGNSWILWNWTNPSEPDFNHTEVWIDGEFKVTVTTPEHTYNATGLSASTTYEVGSRTVDDSGNINQTWMNDTATTLIHDVNVSTDYAATTNGIKIKYNGTEIPASENLTIGDAYDIYYKIVNEGDHNETVNVSVLVANSTWTQTVATHTWNIKIGSYRYSGGDSWDTSALTPGEYNITVNASISIDDNWLNNERIRAVILALPSNLPPISDPNGPYNGTEGEVIQFNGSESYDPDGSIVTYDWDFGDGNTGEGEKPTHTYAQNGTYNVTLNVTDDDGATDANTTTATIADTKPTANFSATPRSGFKPLTVNFTDSSTSYDGIVAWDWNFGDGANSTEQNTSHVYTNAGLYNVTLTVYEDDGNNDSETKGGYITVTNQPPVADPNGPYNDTEGVAIQLNGSGSYDPDGTIVSYDWDFGDGNTSNDENPTHIYLQNGTYTVSLNVTDDEGATDVNTTTATIDDTKPTANFSAMPTSGPEPLTVNFTDKSTSYDGITAWYWDFGDGTNSTEQNPSHTYSAGTYTVNLTVTEGDCDSDTETKVDYINVTRVNQPPVSDPNGPYNGTEGEEILFNGSGSYDPDGSIATYDWDFGDGNTGTGEKPTHTYAQNGTYSVTLNVTDDDGATDANTTTATIDDTKPTANFSCTPTSGPEPVTVNFTDNSTSYDEITAWAWDFGDGDNSSEQDPTHEYTTEGTYIVSLTVHEADGDCDTMTKVDYINVTRVNQPPVSDPNGPYHGMEGNVIQFNGSGSYDPDGSIYNYTWDFGDGSTGTGVSPTHRYTQNGIYTVTLNVIDNEGATDMNTTTATISDTEPTANFSASPTTGLKPLTVDFTDNSTSYDEITAWAWDFGDGNNSNEQNPTHVYTTEGIYIVSLTVLDADGDSDKETKEDYINVTRLNQPPVSDPNGPYAGTEGEAIAFVGTGSFDSDGNIVSYAWDFGDGNTSTDMNTTHTYAQNGTYTVTLNVTDNEGATDTNTTTATIADTLPTANFSGSPTTGLKPLTVDFTDNSTSYDEITAWAWDFGDGNNTNEQNPTHAYANAGLYNVTLTVYEADGNSDTEAKVDYITVTEGNGVNQPPVADANGPYTGVEGVPIAFNGTGSYDPDGSIASYAWDFGDGNTGTGVSQDHTYAQDGTYTVTLIVNDGVRDSVPDATTATVTDTEPTADFSAVPTSGPEPLTVEFTDLSSSYDGIASWSWEFGDGETSNEQNPTHTYMSSGTYTVALTVTEADDDTATKEDYIAVIPAGDTVTPVIESVTLNTYTTIPDATIHVTVEASDNVGVTSVTADDVALVETGSTWEGDITAPSDTDDYTLTIRAEDEAENVAETTVDFSVVTPTGGLGVGILPKISSAPAGSTLPLDIKIVSTENFDDILHLYVNVDGIPLDYQADLSWFNWTEKTVQIPAGQEMVLPIVVDIPSGISGYKSFGVKAESTKWSSDAQDYGAVLVS